ESAQAFATGKTLVVWLDSASDTGTLIEQCHLDRTCGRTFLVGRCPKIDGEDYPTAGMVVWVPFDKVFMIGEFPNAQAAWKCCKSKPAAESPKAGQPKPIPTSQPPFPH